MSQSDLMPAGNLLPSDIRLLAAVRHGLKTHVDAELVSEMARTVCEFSINLLDHVLTRHTGLVDILREQIERESDILRRLASLLLEVGAIDASKSAAAIAVADEAIATQQFALAELEGLHLRIQAGLEGLIPEMAAARSDASSPDGQAAVKAIFKELVESERSAEDAYRRAVEQRARQFEDDAGEGGTYDRAALEGYLRQRFPGGEHAEITSFRELPGGSSKATILFDVKGLPEGDSVPLVARLNRKAGATDTTVLNEIETLKTMFDNGLPVPELIWSEKDPEPLGAPFLIVRKVDGVLGGGMWHADPEVCDASTAKDLARILARLHSFDTSKPGFQGALKFPEALRDHPMKALLANIRGLLASKKLYPVPALEGALCWLEDNMPPASKPALVHADVSFHNIMVRDKKVACLLDWELSHIGDPIEDLSYARLCIEQLMPWEEFLAEYRRHGGGSYSDEVGEYYRVWRDTRNSVYVVVADHSFHSGANLDLRWGFFGTYLRGMTLASAERIVSLDDNAKSAGSLRA